MLSIVQVPLNAEIKMTISSNVAALATKQLFLDENSADFHFVFNSNDDQPIKLPVHKIILAAASPVFKTMFYGSLTEETHVKIVDATFEAFKEFLQYFYLADVTLTMEHVPVVMYLAEKYQVNECLDACSTFLMQHVTADTVCWAYGLAVLFKKKDLMEFCNTVAKSETSVVLQSNGFMECNQKVLRHILKLDDLSCPKTELFDACIAWAKAACQRKGLDAEHPKNIRDQLGQAFYEMPFAELTQANFFEIIPPKISIFEKDDLVEMIQMIASTGFQPSKFVKKTNDQADAVVRIPESCVIESSRIVTDSFLIKDIETTTFSSNKPLLLKGFSCANVFEFRKSQWLYYVTDFPTSEITITMNGPDEQPQKGKSSEILYNGKIDLVTHGTNQVNLPSPILIKPGIKYEIRLHQKAPPSSYTFNTLKSVLHLKPDIEIRFHPDAKLNYDNTATGLVTGLYVERLQTVVNCDLSD